MNDDLIFLEMRRRALPRFDIVSVTIVDGDYLLDSDVIAPGTVIFQVRNVSASRDTHGFYIGRLAVGATENDIRSSRPGVVTRGLVDADIAADGIERAFRLTGLTPGRYVLLCLRPGPIRERFCFQDGMFRIITVTEPNTGAWDAALDVR
jgi:hypothetical protein